MFDNTLTITYATASVTLTKVSEQNFSSTYFAEDSGRKFTMNISHTIPVRGQPGESHLVRLDIEHFDLTGVLLRTSSAWTVIKTFDGVQESAASAYTVEALTSFSTVGNVAKLIGRES